MTLPTEIIFQYDPEIIKNGDPESLQLYLSNLTDTLKNMYQDVAQNVNGTLRQWTPTAYGLTNAGTGTYTSQIGWVRRAGLMTEVWFDIVWSAHTGTGGLAIQMPYKAAKSEGEPWVGVIQSQGSNAFGAGFTYLVMKCEQDTTQGTIVRCGSGVVSSEQQIAATGSYVGYIQYVGQEFEN